MPNDTHFTQSNPDGSAKYWPNEAELLAKRLSKAKRSGQQWVALCPAHDDRNPSLSISNAADGKLLVRCHAGCSQDQVIAACRARGVWPGKPEERRPATPNPARHLNGASKKTESVWKPILPQPDDAPKPPAAMLRCDMLHEYFDANDRLLFYVRRHEGRKGARKTFVPVVYGLLDGTLGWQQRAPNTPRPLYGLNRLSHADPTATVLLCEGEKSADAAMRQFPDHVAMSWMGGTGADAGADWTVLAGRSVLIWPDADDPGYKAATRIHTVLLRLGCQVSVVDTTGLPEKFDAANLECECTDPEGWLRERLPPVLPGPESQVEANPQPDKPSPRGTAFGRLVVYGMTDLDTAPPRSYLLKGLISPAEVSLWVGAPKCGKSFLLMYLAYMLSLGRSVFGRRVKPSKILYVAAEGEAGIAKRICALRNKYGPSSDFHFIAQPIDLLRDAGHKLEVIDAATAVGANLIVIDTLNRVMAGGDENSPQDMGTLVRNASDIKHQTGAHIAIVHHGTKASNGTSPRGHGSLEGADDALIEVVKLEDGSRVATVIHTKDDADGMRWGFGLDVVELGVDDDGDPITTLLVKESVEAPERSSKQVQSLTTNEKNALAVFDRAMKTESIRATVGLNHEERPVLSESVWRRRFYAETEPGESQKKNSRRSGERWGDCRRRAGSLASTILSGVPIRGEASNQPLQTPLRLHSFTPIGW
jgi:hypothetical protein